MRRVAFVTIGCKVNQTETDSMMGLFRQRDFQIADPDEFADVYVINTCSVTHLGERKSRQMIRRAIKTNPEAIVAVAGCFAQVAPDEIAAISGVHVVIGTQDRARIVDLVEAAQWERGPVVAVSDIMHAGQFEDIPQYGLQGRTRAFLKIQEGCENYCSYCIIPYARGPYRSRPLASILSEAQHLVAAGFQEIVLTGINLGAYGREASATTLEDAVRQMLSIKELSRLRLSSLDTVEITDELIGIMTSDPRLCPHLHLPLQSGEDQILKLMNRPYTTADFSRQLERLRRKIPDLAVTTDIIVGFPGETERHFSKTRAFVEQAEFAKIHVFPYSRRRGTLAAAMENQVDEQAKKQRVKVLMETSKQNSAAFRRKFIGRVMPVLVEHDTGSGTEGFTPNYQRVFVNHTRAVAPEANSMISVMIEGLCRDGLSGRESDFTDRTNNKP